MNLLTSNNSQTMSSRDLLVMVNDVRKKYGEKEVRINDFNSRIVDELEGEHYESFVVQNSNKTETKLFNLTMDQCVLVAMRESKMVRRVIRDKLKSMENKQPQIPQTYAEALQLAADQAKQLELAAPKIAFIENLVNRDTLMNATQVGQKHKISAVKLNQYLDLWGVYNKSVKRGRAFNTWFVSEGYGEMKQTDQGFSQPLFTCKGEVWINEKLYSEGLV